jgi:hypothetical protein
MTSDEQRGKEALSYFHNEALSYPQNYSMSLESLCDILQKKSSGAFLDGFGFTVANAGLSTSQVKKAMQQLADAGQGKIPSNWHDFFSALQGQVGNISFIDAASYTFVESVKDIGNGAAAVGNAVITTGSMITTVLPYAVFAALAFIMYSKTRKYAGA